jgi:putative transposase
MAPGGLIYHVLNRANARRRIFDRDGDYLAFEHTLGEVQDRIPMRILAWCLMPNHWHLVLWPRQDGDLSSYMRLVTLTHTQRWHACRDTAGTGHLYQGRFKSFVVQDDAHFLTVCRYVEANALRGHLVRRAEQWRWCSLWRACRGGEHPPRVHPWPVARPPDWPEYVNEAGASSELKALRECARRGTPYGELRWAEQIAGRLGLDCKLRARGRPRKDPFAEKGS